MLRADALGLRWRCVIIALMWWLPSHLSSSYCGMTGSRECMPALDATCLKNPTLNRAFALWIISHFVPHLWRYVVARLLRQLMMSFTLAINSRDLEGDIIHKFEMFSELLCYCFAAICTKCPDQKTWFPTRSVGRQNMVSRNISRRATWPQLGIKFARNMLSRSNC